MFVIILTLSVDFQATSRALARELPNVPICTDEVQELELAPHVSRAEALHLASSYARSGLYDRVQLVRR